MCAAKETIIREINSIVRSASKNGNFDETYIKLYNEYNKKYPNSVLINSKEKSTSILNIFAHADKLEELLYIAQKTFLNNPTKPKELKEKEKKLRNSELLEMQKNQKELIEREKQTVSIDDLKTMFP